MTYVLNVIFVIVIMVLVGLWCEAHHLYMNNRLAYEQVKKERDHLKYLLDTVRKNT